MSSLRLPPSDLWLDQARSDLAVLALLVRSDGDALEPRLRCQAIAKAQQVVEKSVKGMYGILLEHGAIAELVAGVEWFDHYPAKMMAALFISTTRRRSRPLLEAAQALLGGADYGSATALCGLAPSGDLRLNTEYPYLARGGWATPADEDAFAATDVERYRRVATEFLSAASKLRDSAILGFARRR